MRIFETIMTSAYHDRRQKKQVVIKRLGKPTALKILEQGLPWSSVKQEISKLLDMQLSSNRHRRKWAG